MLLQSHKPVHTPGPSPDNGSGSLGLGMALALALRERMQTFIAVHYSHGGGELEDLGNAEEEENEGHDVRSSPRPWNQTAQISALPFTSYEALSKSFNLSTLLFSFVK